jgi:hypothetical protein
MSVYLFFEGSTEETVIKHLFSDRKPKPISARGKGGLNVTLISTLGPLVSTQPIRCLVLRDLDAHEGETPQRLIQSLSDALSRMLTERTGAILPQFELLNSYDNVWTWSCEQPDIRVAFCLAAYRWKPEFIKATIDDYILALSLEPSIAARLAERVEVSAETVIAKITQELPALLAANGIQLVESKDYVRLYAAVVKSHTSPAVFAQKVLSHISDEQMQHQFAALIAAMTFLEGA